MQSESLREWILELAHDKFSTDADYPFDGDSVSAVLRHPHNKKWFGLVMKVPRVKLGLSGEGVVDILNVKTDPALSAGLITQAGIYPAYHMNKTKWLSVLLDGSVDRELVEFLLTASYSLTFNKK